MQGIFLYKKKKIKQSKTEYNLKLQNKGEDYYKPVRVSNFYGNNYIEDEHCQSKNTLMKLSHTWQTKSNKNQNIVYHKNFTKIKNSDT